MIIQYGGTKKNIAESRETMMNSIAATNKTDKALADAVNSFVDTLLKNKAIHDNTRVDVSASSGERGLSVNVTYDSPVVVNQPATPPKGEALTKKAEREKQAANAKVTTIKRTQPEAPKK